MADPQTDPVADLLRRAPASDDLRAQAWDIFHQAPDEDALALQLKSLQIPDAVKADLWDLKRSQRPATAQTTPEPDATSAPERGWLTSPTVGGIVGGIAGGLIGGFPGAVGGATLLGATAEAKQSQDERAAGQQVSPVEAAERLGIEGAKQGAYTVAGEGASRLLGPVADLVTGPIARGVMKVGAGINARLSAEFPNLSQTLIDNALTASKGGYEQARALLRTAAGKTRALITAADAKNLTVPVSDAVAGLQKTYAEQVANSSDIQGGRTLLLRLQNRITGGRGADLTIAEADKLKSSLQLEADRAYAAAGRPKSLPLEVIAKRDMAASLNASINQAMEKGGVPGYAAANGSEQELIGAVRALEKYRGGGQLARALLRPGVAGFGAGATLGYATGQNPFETGVAGALFTSPYMLSKAATMAHPAVQALLRLLPRATVESIRQIMQSSPTEPPSSESFSPLATKVP